MDAQLAEIEKIDGITRDPQHAKMREMFESRELLNEPIRTKFEGILSGPFIPRSCSEEESEDEFVWRREYFLDVPIGIYHEVVEGVVELMKSDGYADFIEQTIQDTDVKRQAMRNSILSLLPAWNAHHSTAPAIQKQTMPKRDAAGRSLSLTSQESYSAVIIADMVAEVPIDDNSAHKDHLPAVVDVQLEEKSPKHRNNGAAAPLDMGKGVILNVTAAQFTSDGLVPDPAKQKRRGSEPPRRDFRSMSLPRKIAFGFSFLPSVMFVLCFAVILPCRERPPCVQRVWANVMPDVAVSSQLWLSENRLMFATRTASSGQGSLSWLDTASGIQIWSQALQEPASFVLCDRLNEPDSEACLVGQNSAKISLYIYNETHGSSLWERNLEEDGVTPAPYPAILPDCGDGENVSRVAMAMTRAQIKVLIHGALLRTVNVGACESVPRALTPWPRGNDTDLLFACGRGDKVSLMKLTQKQWCLSEKKSKSDILTIHTMPSDELEKSVLLPTEEGLVLWVKDQILMFDKDGKKLWSASSGPHSTENRFLLFGKFSDTGSQVALFSSSLKGNLTVSTHNPASGEITWSKVELNSEISDVALIHGKEMDFAAVTIRKASPGTLASEALQTMDAVSSTLASVLTQENVPSTPEDTTHVTSEVSFLHFSDSFLRTVHKIPLGGVSTIKVDPSYKSDSETISIYTLRNPVDDSSEISSQIERIDVAYWDISQNKESSCKWKQ